MTVQILGNGGAISDGLKYNSFVIDLHLLIEVPPDIIETLFSNSIPINQIEEIFISHLHGDHCFGFPFLALKQFFDGKNELIRLIGPKGIENRLKELTILAFGSDHPVMNWINSHYSFLEISETLEVINFGQFEIQPIQMNHFIETYGFKINDHPPFAYLADTLWKQDFLHYLQDENLTVLADLNGEESDKVKVHMSENDISEFAIPFMSQSATILGTHLKKNKVSSIKQIKYVHPGETYSI